MIRAVAALFAAACVAGLAGTGYAMAATPNPAYVAVVCGVPALAAGVLAWIAHVGAGEERRERVRRPELQRAGSTSR